MSKTAPRLLAYYQHEHEVTMLTYQSVSPDLEMERDGRGFNGIVGGIGL